MINNVKIIEETEQVLQQEALLRRMLESHPKWLTANEDYRKYQAGYAGEKQLGYELSNLHSAPDLYLALHNIRLHSYAVYYFQMDFILLTRFFGVILDAKHLKGDVHFKDSDHVIKQTDGNNEILKNPVEQVLRHERLLSAFLTRHGFPKDYPLIGRVVYTSPYTTITSSEQCREAVAERVIRAESLFSKLLQLQQTYPRECVSENSLYRMASLIKKHHTPYWKDMLKCYNLTYRDLQPGVHCPDCGNFPIIQPAKAHSWYCSQCQKIKPQALEASLQDYAMIIGRTITNQEAREFLCTSNRDLVRRILIKAGRKYGEKRHARYRISLPWESE